MSNPKRWGELSDKQKKLVERYIETLLKIQDPIPLIEKPGREVVEQRIVGSVTYQLERIKCGKKKCKCTGGALHGPYWYAYFRQGGRLKSKYIGKTLGKSYVTGGGIE